jgi:hypothetical protein
MSTPAMFTSRGVQPQKVSLFCSIGHMLHQHMIIKNSFLTLTFKKTTLTTLL